MCYTPRMNSTEKKASFLWGAPHDVAARVSDGFPSFRLCRTAEGFEPVDQAFEMPGTGDVRHLQRNGKTVATLWSDDNADYCFLAGVLPADLSAPRPDQARSVFLELEAVLAEAGFTFAHVARTWLYIDEVCSWYTDFNAARTAFFEERNVFKTFLPASTGIGCANLDGAAITAGAIAVKPRREGVTVEIVDSPLQAPAMAYRSSFSRASEICAPDVRRLFISGTASIEPNSHEVAFVGDIDRQIVCTMKAVYAILESRGYGWRDVTRAIVYLKKPEFRAAWRAWLAANGLPASFAAETVCDVCRDEWLFEIEVDAVRQV